MRMKRVEFSAPEGSVPEGTASGEEFDAVCTFRVSNNGTICLVKLGDTEMPGYNGKEDSKPSYDSYSKPMMESGMEDA